MSILAKKMPRRTGKDQQSIGGGAAIKKQSTLLDNKEEKEKFAFASFFSCSDAAAIAAGREVEVSPSRETEKTVYLQRTRLPRRRGPGHRVSKRPRREGVGHEG